MRALRCGGTKFACVRRLSRIGTRWHGLSRWTRTPSKSCRTSARRIPKRFRSIALRGCGPGSTPGMCDGFESVNSAKAVEQ